MASGSAQVIRIGERHPPRSALELDQWNDEIEAMRSKASLGPDEKKKALSLALSVLDGTQESILRQKALLLCAELFSRNTDLLPRDALRDHIRAILGDARANIWEQVAALLICWRLERPMQAAAQLAALLEMSHAREDGFFLRANLMEHAKHDHGFFEFLRPQFQRLIFDTSAYVRIRALELLTLHQESMLLLERCEEGETDPQVQPALLYCFAELLFGCETGQIKRVEQAFQRFYGQFSIEARSAFLMRLNEHLMTVLHEGQGLAEARRESLAHVLEIVRRDEQDVLLRHSSLTRRCLQILDHTEQRALFVKLAKALAAEKNSETFVWTHSASLQDIGPVLTVLAYFGLGYEIREKTGEMEIRPAYGFSLSVWRFIHELKTPSGNKRQGAAHWKSRHLQGEIRIPSSLTCELVATTVPGEPLYIPEAGGWRPWLPLLCDVYRMIFRFPVLRILTADGVTTVERPGSWMQRAKAWLLLVFGYERVSRLRNWTARHGADPAAYIKRLHELGFSTRFVPAHADDNDSTIMKFFGRES
ncbi:MAG TPA: hypothetical protein VFO10_21505 [Oligoflexus sp.]|uniref:hypothetical protein n=1 Tax=Oligoflexus sp. TaxID=1971216 RepID=UPI002D7E73FE|nr:hypothetical protein [Oligoflexus sp.]HET9239852.1 hypothetical protein [Oligoflexus sp.]